MKRVKDLVINTKAQSYRCHPHIVGLQLTREGDTFIEEGETLVVSWFNPAVGDGTLRGGVDNMGSSSATVLRSLQDTILGMKTDQLSKPIFPEETSTKVVRSEK